MYELDEQDLPEEEITITYSSRTPEEVAREARRLQVVSKRAVLLGMLLFALLAGAAFMWRLSSSGGTLDRLREFEFTVDEPVQEEFELKEPMRDILQEIPEEKPEEIEVEERPDIHMTVVPTDVEVTEEIIQSQNIEVETPDIQIDATEIDIDAPEEISEVSEAVTWALNPIAARSMDPAELFAYKDPSPRDKPLQHVINRAPRASRSLKVLPKAFGDQDAPSMGELGPMNVNLFGTGDFFRTMTRSGGIHARSSVDSALHWLAIHQEPSGIWNAEKYEGKKSADVGVSSLALLAFMGGGHTIRKGEYRRNVMRGINELIRRQGDDGRIGKASMYGHIIATIALCESYGRARDERVGLAARKGIAYLEKAAHADGGWRYSAEEAPSDMSVTGWAIQALKTAKLAQIKFDHAVYSRALLFVDSVTDRGGSRDSTGVVGYLYQADQAYDHGRPAMTCAAMIVRQFSGVGVKSHLLVKGAELAKTIPPEWKKKDFYLWYYATYAMHNMGGEYRVWWNRRIRDVLLQNQCKEGDNAGSWDPKGDNWAEDNAGRVYTTALGALCLEVYYRYSQALNSFGVAPDLDDLFLQ